MSAMERFLGVATTDTSNALDLPPFREEVFRITHRGCPRSTWTSCSCGTRYAQQRIAADTAASGAPLNPDVNCTIELISPSTRSSSESN